MQTVSTLSAEDFLQQGRLDEARAACRETLERNADNRPALLMLTRIERCCGNERAACEYLRRVAKLEPNCIEVLGDLAGLLRELGCADEAVAVYRQTLTLDRQFIAAYFGLGWIARARHNEAEATTHFSTAREYLRMAVARDPNNRQFRMQLATALRESGSLDEAAAIYQCILASETNHGAAQEGLGWIARKRGNHESALEHFRAAAALNPGDPVAQLSLAKLLAAAGRVAEAQAIYSRINAQPTQRARVRVMLGTLARSWRDLDAAVTQFRAALALDAENIESRMELGRTFYDQACWDEAEESFRRVCATSPHHIDARIALAESVEARGDRATAFALFEAAAALAPFDYRPKNAIRRLKAAQGCYDWRTEIEEAVAVARASDATGAAQVEAARTLVQYGLTEVAAPLLAGLQGNSAEARQLVLALRQIVRMGLAQPLTAGAAHPDPLENQLESLQGYLEKPAAGSDTLLLVFAGTNNRAWMTFSLLHRILQKTGVSIVYVRDLQLDWYAGGIVGLGHDFESTVEGVRKLAARYGARRILALGNCVGCLAALRYGLSLGAEAVLGFGPKLRAGNHLQFNHRMSLQAFRAKQPASHISVQARYLATAERPKVTLFFGERCSDDAAAASAMSEVPGVAVTAIPGSAEPDSLKDLLVLGLLELVLQDFVRNGSVASIIHERIAGSSGLGQIA